MSRSNPTSNTPNPATRWFEWKGKEGTLQYYDKTKKETIAVALPFQFILLDRTATVRGYNKKLKSGIYSNEVRDTRAEPFVVKCFAGGVVAEGVWKDIKDRVTSRSTGGCFAMNCYIAFKIGKEKELTLGAIQVSGCALGPWFEFEKEHRRMVDNPSDPKKKVQELYAKAVTMDRGAKNDSGEIEFVPPKFGVKDISADSNAKAIELDKQLQEYLTDYFKRSTVVRAEPSATLGRDLGVKGEADGHGAGDNEPPADHDPSPESVPDPEDDVPF